MAHSILYTRIMNSKEWRSVRARKLYEQPFCEVCGRSGVIRDAEAVHHIKEVESGRSERECWELALAENNLMSVCFRCHRDIHTGSHTKKAHKKRQEDRMAAWVSQQEGQDPLERLLGEIKKAP